MSSEAIRNLGALIKQLEASFSGEVREKESIPEGKEASVIKELLFKHAEQCGLRLSDFKLCEYHSQRLRFTPQAGIMYISATRAQFQPFLTLRFECEVDKERELALIVDSPNSGKLVQTLNGQPSRMPLRFDVDMPPMLRFSEDGICELSQEELKQILSFVDQYLCEQSNNSGHMLIENMREEIAALRGYRTVDQFRAYNNEDESASSNPFSQTDSSRPTQYTDRCTQPWQH